MSLQSSREQISTWYTSKMSDITMNWMRVETDSRTYPRVLPHRCVKCPDCQQSHQSIQFLVCSRRLKYHAADGDGNPCERTRLLPWEPARIFKHHTNTQQNMSYTWKNKQNHAKVLLQWEFMSVRSGEATTKEGDGSCAFINSTGIRYTMAKLQPPMTVQPELDTAGVSDGARVEIHQMDWLKALYSRMRS